MLLINFPNLEPNFEPSPLIMKPFNASLIETGLVGFGCGRDQAHEAD